MIYKVSTLKATAESGLTKKDIFYLITWYLLCTVPWLGLTDFHTRGEGREALVALSMWQTGDLILPEGYGGDIPSKPPFLHWCIVLFSSLVGAVTELTVRLPSITASALFLGGYGLFLLRFRPPLQALAAILALAMSPEWARHAVAARVDMIHSTALSAGLLLAFLHGENILRVGWTWSIPALFSIAVLSKGPVGVVLPALVLLFWWAIERRSMLSLIKKFVWYFGPAIAIPALWYLAAYWQGSDQFLAKVIAENFGRFNGSMDGDPHSHSVLYLLGTLIAGALPIFLLPCWNFSLSDFFSFNLRKIFNWNECRNAWNSICFTAQPLLRFSLITVCIVTLFYSIPQSKRPVYLLSSYPFWAILLAATLPASSHNVNKARDIINCLCWFSRRVYPVLLGIPLLVSLCFLIPWGVMREFAYGALVYRGYPHIVGLVVVSTLLVIVGLFIKRADFNAESPRLVVKVFVGLLGGIFLEALVILWPGVGYLASEKRIAQVVQAIITPDVTIKSFMHEFYGVSFYLKRRIDRLEEQKVTQDKSKKSVILLRNRNEQDFNQWIGAQSKIRISLLPLPLSLEGQSKYSYQADVDKTNKQISLLEGKVLLYQVDYDL
jgi:4-amino-4-deoxy-L-arabinose transferase-like glycosyltransferase